MSFSFFRQLQKRDRDFHLEVDGRALPVRVIENDRAKRLILRISPGGDELRVSTPGHVADDEIESFVKRNRNWVGARLSRIPERKVLGVGATVLYQGIEHRIEKTGKLRGVIEVQVGDDGPQILVPGDHSSIPRRLAIWLKDRARKELNEAVDRHATQINVRPKQIRITDTTSRWGSCSSTRTLSFSWRIIMAPPEVLDYLAAHELSLIHI